MDAIFLKIVNMSISACWIVLAIILLRVVLKKAPKWINCVLWGIAGLRLVMPFSFESIFSLIPSTQTLPQEVLRYEGTQLHEPAYLDVISNPLFSDGISIELGQTVDRVQLRMVNMTFVWLIGIAVLVLYTIISYWRLSRKVNTAVLYRDNIFQSENVSSPFVLGIIKPKIYLPFNMNGQDMEHVIAHEQAHIRRKDYLWKPLGFLILTLHWFNPMVWLGYILLCRDIELACDEKVVKELNSEQRADYSEALLTCSVNRRMIAACPLAFGEVGVKDRIKSVLNYKKPAFWIIIAAVIASIAVALCFLTNPVKPTDIQNGSYNLTEEIYFNGSYSYIPNFENDRIEIKTVGGMHIYYFTGEVLSTGGLYEEIKLNKENFSNLFDGSTGWSKYENAGELLKNNKSAWYHSIPQDFDGYPYILLLQKDGSLCIAFADLENGTPTRVRYIYELEYEGNIENSYDSTVGGSEKLTWSYNPSLSHTSHYTRAFVFDCEYTHVDATCTGGEFWNLEAEGQPRDTDMRFEKGKTVYWTPGEGDGKSADKSEVTLTVYNGESKLQQHTVIFECVSRNYSVGEYEIYLRDTAEFVLVYSEDGYLTFVERSSISNVDSADSMLDVAFESTLTYAGIPQNSNKIFFSSLNREKLTISSVRHLPIHRLNTYEDFKNFKNTFSGDLTFDKSYDEVPSFNAATAKYDKDFFEDNSLMVIYIDATNSTHRYAMQSIEHNGAFCVHIEETTKAEAVNYELSGWFVTVTASDELLNGCTEFDADFNNTIDLYDGSKIPELTVSCNGVSAEAVMGTTEWTYDNGDGTMQTINGDSAHPTDRIEYLLPNALKVKRTDDILTAVTMNFDTNPDATEVNSWFIAENGSIKPFDADKKGLDIFLNPSKETCIYEVVATWNKSSKYYGTVRYSFCVEYID